MTDAEYICPTCGRHKPCRHCPTAALTEALTQHERKESRLSVIFCDCGWEEGHGITWDEHLAAALVPVVTQQIEDERERTLKRLEELLDDEWEAVDGDIADLRLRYADFVKAYRIARAEAVSDDG